MTYFTKPFFTLVFAIQDIYPLVILLDIIGIVLILFKERFEPRTFVFWLMIIIVLPVAGFLLYLITGCTLYGSRMFSVKEEQDRDVLSDVPTHAVSGLDMGSGLDYAVSGNSSKVYWNPGDNYTDLIADLARAERTVMMEMRRFQRSGYDGLMDALCDASSRGVKVRVMSGTYGFGRTRRLRRQREAGIEFRTFHNIFYSTFSIRNSCRLLRGIIVIDGKVAYSGAETVVRVEGPAASRLERRFAADWRHASGEILKVSDGTGVSGTDIVQVTSGGPDVGGDGPTASEYMALISASKDRIFMTFEYLVPDEVLYNSIRLAVFSGVEVHLLIPRRGRHWYQAWNSLSASNELMLAGVNVYFTDKRTIRNVVVCDGKVASVGSAVFNTRSMRYDFSTNVVVFSESLASDMEGRFREELASAVRCLPEEYARRSLADRLRIVASRMLMFFN